MMVLGFLLHEKTPLLNDSFAGYLNTFVFQIALPTQLFKNLSESDFYTVWDGGVVVFCFAVSLLSIKTIPRFWTIEEQSKSIEFLVIKAYPFVK